MEKQNNWSQLPEDLLLLILKHLPLLDHLRFHAVCATWRSIASKKFYPPAAQLPWLILPNDDFRDTKTCNFLSLSDKKTYKIDVPEFSHSKRRHWIGSGSGWLATVYENSRIFLVNPFSKSNIGLPSAIRLPNLPPTADFSKIKLALKPPVNNKDYVVLVIPGLYSKLIYCKQGDKKWTVLQTLGRCYTDVIYRNGKFYGANLHGTVNACDFSGASPKLENIGRLQIAGWMFLVDCQGDLLLVSRKFFCPNSLYDFNFEVFKFDGENKWVRVMSLGDRAVFIGLSESLSLSVQEVPEAKMNCIYFADDNSKVCFSKHWREELGIYRLEDGRVEPYYDSENPISPPSIWFRPNPL